MAPFAPFLAEELWSRLGEAFSIHATSWPEHDPKLIEEERVVIAVQINGKLRETLEIDFSLAKNKNEVEERAKKSEKVEKYLKDKELKKTIFVPGKLINFVVS
jgi:leucyl-tRNA synthetase